MKDFLRRGLLIATWIFAALSQDTSADAWKSGHGCSKHYCLENKGHFDEESFLPASIPYRSYKLLYSLTPTNFVVYIRNISNPSQHKNFLQICAGRKCEFLSSTEDQVFTFMDVNQVTIVLSSPSTKLQAQYYAGCDIIDKTDLGFELNASSSTIKEGRCWVIIPRLHHNEDHHDKDHTDADHHDKDHTAATNLFLTKVNLPPNSKLSLFNVITGEVLMSLGSSTDLDFTTVENTGRKTSSSMFMLSVDACPESLCSFISFKIQAQALDDQGYQCFQERQLCDYEMAEDEGISCDEVEATECSAYQEFGYIVDAALGLLTVDSDSDLSERGFSKSQKRRKKINMQCKNSFKSQKWKKKLCGKRSNGELWNCDIFRICTMTCVELRFVHNVCGLIMESPSLDSSLTLMT